MPNFPGSGNALPGVYSEVVTLSRGVSVPGGVRTAVIMGEGSRRETIVASAVGGGRDGLNPQYTSASGSDGRHFILNNYPLISNRTQLFKNGIPLSLIEQPISTTPLSSQFDARIDINNGRIELQTARLVDQGGDYYSASATNVGNGTVNGLSLVDPNAPTETWVARCVSTRRDGYGIPIDGYGKFIVQGTVSGIILDGYGNQIVWQSNGSTVSNGILSFSITDGTTTFREGDKFTINVQGGALVKGDSLTATYIAVADINDIEYFTDQVSVQAKHGYPSLTNRLSLGAQLAFSNNTPGIYTIQCAPSIPRRVSYSLVSSAPATPPTIDDLRFPLPVNIVPDVDSSIHFFITDPITGVETQILPNKVSFYDPSITSNPSSFVFGPSYAYSYTVILNEAEVKKGEDGELTALTATTAVFSSSTVAFGVDDASASRSLKIYDAAYPDNNGTFAITQVKGGKLYISRNPMTQPGSFASEPDLINTSKLRFQVVDSSVQSAEILFTQDLALSAGQSLRATVVDEKDATFFDVGWTNAYAALQKVDLDIVVPLPSQTISAIFANGQSHVTTMSNVKNKRERALFIGAIQGLTPDNVVGLTPAAVEDIGIFEGVQGDDITEILSGDIEDLTDYGVPNSYGKSIRTVYFYPDQIVVQIGADRVFVDGFFISAAAAGYLCGMPNIAIPLTNKTLSGFTILRDKLFAPVTLENLAAAGITVLQPVLGGGLVLWGKTTTGSGFPEEEEISILFIRDRIAKVLRTAFGGFIGNPESPTFLGSLYVRADGIMKSFVSQGIITAYQDLSVKRDAVDPRQWNISVGVQPTYPVNWIYIRVNLGVL